MLWAEGEKRMNGYWLILYDGNGRRLGQAWWYQTQAEAEHEAQMAFQDSEKIREAIVWRWQPDLLGRSYNWRWEKTAEVRRAEPYPGESILSHVQRTGARFTTRRVGWGNHRKWGKP